MSPVRPRQRCSTGSKSASLDQQRIAGRGFGAATNRNPVVTIRRQIATVARSTMQIRELNHVAIQVADVERSRDFYRRVLQLSPLPRPAFSFPGAWFRLGTTQELHLIGERGEPVIAGSRGNHFALQVEDLAAWEAQLRQTGAEFLPKKRRPDGAWQIFVRDPDGHYIELFTPPD
jgi:lactoylglutathione lyase